MNRNVIYGSFSELEGWRESRADGAVAHNTSRHVAIPKLILLSSLEQACYTDYTFVYNYYYYAIAFIT